MSHETRSTAPDQAASRKSIELAVKLTALAILAYGSVALVRPFVPILIWAVVLCVALYPIYGSIVRWLGGRRGLAAALLTLLSLAVIIGPATWLAIDVIEGVAALSSASDLARWSLPPPPPGLKEWPIVGEPLQQFWDLAATNLRAAVTKLAPLLKPIAAALLTIAAGAGAGVLQFFVGLVVAGFLFAPAPSLLSAARKLGRRLAPERGERLLQLAASTIRTVSRGVVGIAVLQASLLGLGFSVFGVPGASLLTSASLVLAILQVGPALVVIPTIVWAWSTLSPSAALLFTAYMVPVNLIDNLLRPFVMSRGLGIPMPVILLGVIGGTISQGVTGLFLGPIVLAVLYDLMAAWVERQDDDEPEQMNSVQQFEADGSG